VEHSLGLFDLPLGFANRVLQSGDVGVYPAAVEDVSGIACEMACIVVYQLQPVTLLDVLLQSGRPLLG
jgi:hypothetical protein